MQTYSPLARLIADMDETTQKRMERKFDICYMLVKENMAFRKYTPIYDLELRHSVNLGHSYKTKDSAKNFTHYIAESQKNEFPQSLSSTRF